MHQWPRVRQQVEELGARGAAGLAGADGAFVSHARKSAKPALAAAAARVSCAASADGMRFDANPSIDAGRQQDVGAVALTQHLGRATRPERRCAIDSRAPSRKRGIACRRATAARRAALDGGERPRHQRDDAEGRLAQRPATDCRAGNGVPRAPAICTSRNEIASARSRAADVAQASAAGRASDSSAARTARISATAGVEPVGRPVGQPIVVIVDAGERRVHRTQPVVAFEELAKGGHLKARAAARPSGVRGTTARRR